MRVPPGIWRGPPAASTLVRVFVSACPALAAHLLCDCPHAHGDPRASQSAVDVRGTIVPRDTSYSQAVVSSRCRRATARWPRRFARLFHAH